MGEYEAARKFGEYLKFIIIVTAIGGGIIGAKIQEALDSGGTKAPRVARIIWWSTAFIVALEIMVGRLALDTLWP